MTSCIAEKQVIKCTEYNWSDVELLAEPYLDEELFTSLVMQGQSSQYQPSAAAEHALGISDTYPDSVESLLKKIQECE